MHALTLSPTTGVVVTGGASGIGRACAHALGAVGRPVAIWDRDAEGARDAAGEIAAEHGVATMSATVDVTDASRVDAALGESRDALGTVGGLVHAAGMVIPQPVGAIQWSDWDATIAVNLTAHAQLVQAMHGDLVANPGSAVVAIASIEAMVGHGAIPAYCASKAGLVGLTRSLAMQLGPLGVRANAVCPGYTDTPMLAPTIAMPEVRAHMEASSVLGRLATPDDIARVVRFLLSDEAAFITGVALAVDGGVTAID